MGLLNFGDQRLPVLWNTVDLARAPIRLAPDERRRSMSTDLLQQSDCSSQAALGRSPKAPSEASGDPRLPTSALDSGRQRLRRRRALPVVFVVKDRDRYDRKLDAAGRHIRPKRIERPHRIAAIGIDDHP